MLAENPDLGLIIDMIEVLIFKTSN